MRPYSQTVLRLIAKTDCKATRVSIYTKVSCGWGGDPDILGKTDCLPVTATPSNMSIAYYYDRLYSQLVGNYENWARAHPVKDRRLTTYRTALGVRENLVFRSLATKVYATFM